MMTNRIRLGINIDHVATIRNARGGEHPDPVQAAKLAEKSGADGITAHLREDRRHIIDLDIARLRTEIKIPLNLEMAATEEMLQIAIKYKPHAVCIVPENRRELTTEGGLDVESNFSALKSFVKELSAAGIRTSLFITPELKQLEACANIDAPVIELHVGRFCEASKTNKLDEFKKIIKATEAAESLGLECHAGHGLTFKTVSEIARIPNIVELNIGHFLIGESIFMGLSNSIKNMKKLIDKSRAGAKI